jgi:hypothetical protein
LLDANLWESTLILIVQRVTEQGKTLAESLLYHRAPFGIVKLPPIDFATKNESMLQAVMTDSI